MSDQDKRPARQQFASRVRLQVAGEDEISERYVGNLSDGGLFVRHDRPPAVGALVLLEFVLPNGTALCRAAGRVVHSRPALTPGEKTAGMGLEFVQLDSITKSLVEKFRQQTKGATKTVEDAAGDKGLSIAKAAHRPTLVMQGPVVGIDLGTVNSCVAVVQQGVATVISSTQGYETIPSVVFVKGGKTSVGHKAVERMILEPQRAIYGSKRFLGRPHRSREVLSLGHFFNYGLVSDQRGYTAAKVGDEVIPLEQVAGAILASVKAMAESQLGTEVHRAVITVPAYFGETQRSAVREAARLAGLYVERLISEPTAAAVAYGYGRDIQRTVLVYDLGGGTFDVSVMRIDKNTLTVLATDGDAFLGGSDFDDRLTEYVLMTFERSGGVDVRHDPVAIQRIRFACEMAKKQLSEVDVALIELPYIAQTDAGSIDLHAKLERNLLEALTQDLVDRTMKIVDGVLKTAGLAAAQLDDIILVGGQTRSPHVRRTLAERFGRKPSSSVHPDQAVAIGAAIVADIMHGANAIELTDLLPASIRAGRPDGRCVLLIGRGTRLPVSKGFDVTAQTLGADLKLVLCRGESAITAENTPLGLIDLSRELGEADSSSVVPLTITVSDDGLLSVTVKDPSSGAVRELEVSLQGTATA